MSDPPGPSNPPSPRPIRLYLHRAVLASGAILTLGAGLCTVPVVWDLFSTGGTRLFNGPEGWLLIALFGGTPIVTGLALVTLGTRLLNLRWQPNAAAVLAFFSAGLTALSAINLLAVFREFRDRDMAPVRWTEAVVAGGVPFAVGIAGLAFAAWVLTREQENTPSDTLDGTSKADA